MKRLFGGALQAGHGRGGDARHSSRLLLGAVAALAVLLTDLLLGLAVIPRRLNDFRTAHPYYHHGLLPNRSDIAVWGDREYPMFTNSLGLRDGSTRAVELDTGRRRLLVVGDSFIEGVGVPYGQTVAALIARGLGVETLDAGVVSYSPKLYDLKARYLIEQVGLKVTDLLLFIDISDVMNELEYEDFTPRPVSSARMLAIRVERMLRRHSAVYYLADRLLVSRRKREERERLEGENPMWKGRYPEIDNGMVESAWTFDEYVFARWGARGLALAERNVQHLVDLCRAHGIRMTLAVYPWTPQILYDSADSIQVRFWRRFAEARGIGFIEYFTDFIGQRPARGPVAVCERYFLPGDVHWNAEGHKLIAEKAIRVLGP